ncbi:hypothetical protein [Pseudonocardia sp. NPDC049635]|uniref:hypothetical protein n=1 Tax=Pseudonocardia sp. NPDC049635 TaxID=3155506 RepID=UPI0033EB16DF
MTIRARTGRARHFTSARAVVRERPTPYPEEDPVRAARRIDTAAQLADWCQDAGYRTRQTSGGGWLVYGPVDTAVIPSRWGHGRGRKNVMSNLRAAGLDLSPLDADEAQHRDDDTDRTPTPADIAKLVVNDRPRPVLAYSKTAQEDTMPEEQPTPPPAEVSAEDFLALLDRVEQLEQLLADTRAELQETRDQLPHIGPTAKEVQARERRERIITWFQQLPPGFRVTAGMVNENLGVPEEERRAYGETLRQLVADRVLITANGGVGERGGRHAHYELAREPEQAAS